jgi:MFS family permease
MCVPPPFASFYSLGVLVTNLPHVATALPKLASAFNALDELTWIVSAYLLTQAGFILIYGQLLTILPTKWVYLFTIFIFEVGSLICGVAPSMKVLVSNQININNWVYWEAG